MDHDERLRGGIRSVVRTVALARREARAFDAEDRSRVGPRQLRMSSRVVLTIALVLALMAGFGAVASRFLSRWTLARSYESQAQACHQKAQEFIDRADSPETEVRAYPLDPDPGQSEADALRHRMAWLRKMAQSWRVQEEHFARLAREAWGP